MTKVTDDDPLRIARALNPAENPFTFGESHYLVTGLALGFLLGMTVGTALLILLANALGT